MQLRQIETPGIAHYAYLIGDAGVGAIVDPRRDVDEYLTAARELGVRIEYVIETHRQEDFVLGSAQLAARVGARIVNGQHECFGRGDLRLADGEEFTLGRLRIRALHTPGHTPEGMCYALHLPGDDRPWGVFTGDTLMFGDTGRTDLPASERVGDNAGLLFDSVQQKLAPLPDETQVFPAHGPGSVCGSGVAERPMSTIGLERRSNPVFTLERGAFVARREADQLPRPPYFRHMEIVNLEGGLPPARRAGDVPLLAPEELAPLLGGEALLIDIREPEAFAAGHIPGAYSIWTGGLVPFAGWIASPTSPVYLCTNDDAEVDPTVAQLARIGVDEVRGALRGGFGTWRASGREIATNTMILPRELADMLDDLSVLDVREAHEFESGHIPEARNVYVGELERELDSLPFDRHRPIAVTCGVGHRGSLAASMLARAGFTDVRNLLGGMRAWTAAALPSA
ncbi:MAG: rhodanese-like domain-containing protein [Enhygromyxa sp.]